MMLLLLNILLISVAQATDDAWTPLTEKCHNLVYSPSDSVEACRDSCAADDMCEVYQFQARRRGGDCFKGEYDPDHCFGDMGGRRPTEGAIKTCDVVKEECCRYIIDYELVPHQTWGRTPRNLRGEWRFYNCDEVVGGPEATECPYTCSDYDGTPCASNDDCEDFCNFDDGTSGVCERCQDIANGCANDGFDTVEGQAACEEVCESGEVGVGVELMNAQQTTEFNATDLMVYGFAGIGLVSIIGGAYRLLKKKDVQTVEFSEL